jgi:small GTP-binding protein
MLIDGENVKLQIWDTAGQERFRAMTAAFYNKAQGVMLTFDVSQEQSYKSLDIWIRDIRQYSPQGVVIILCANKADLPIEKWAISREEFKVYASERGILSFECSASTGLNVTEIFNELGREVLKNCKNSLQKVDEPADKENLVLFDSPAAKKDKKSKCC